jgi:hypothetical protein
MADSLEELADIMGRHGDTLKATVARYNTNVEAQSADEFGKSPDRMPALLTPPFYALDLSPEGDGRGSMRRSVKLFSAGSRVAIGPADTVCHGLVQ